MRIIKPFLILAIGLLLAFLAQYLHQGSYTGLIVLGIWLFIYLLWDNYHFLLIKRWVSHPNQSPPASVGRYEDILTPTYKTIRSLSSHLKDLSQLNQNILWAANAFPAAVVILDTHYIIRWCNKATNTLLHIDYQKDVGYNVLNYIRSPKFYDYVIKQDWSTPYLCIEERNGHPYHLKFELMQYSSENILLLCFDNTQIEKLRTTQQDFIANVSHELRTPLTVLSGFLETLRELPPEAVSPEQRTHFEHLMQEQANRMLAIVSDLLTLSTLESTQLVNPQPVPVISLLEQAKRQIQALSAGQHHFSWDIDENLVINGDAHELNSAMTNLLTNAVRYTPSGGTIEVYWGLNDDGEPTFSVKDSGLGIASSDLHRITERFYRVDKSRSRASGGTGLGLAITKHIAMRHHAKLNIKSKLHKGSTFSLVFPKESITSLI
ncbi:phosphate regulon sensor histidine kinase PhoR [Pelistega europaea]|uniref:histidine kinase n=1 Tax=Pelistega europaea TaxID=106147 RepID=A0A7Y4L8Y4_9BURK|nr:phosphate regulon sensor histidine kinase PhoR [Pelistega europaea]NOL49172.1 phosphate regulon sensor histidine kinase PhoR [Pelistega europaea]